MECLNLIFKILANIEYSKHSATDISVNLFWWIQLASESGIQWGMNIYKLKCSDFMLTKLIY